MSYLFLIDTIKTLIYFHLSNTPCIKNVIYKSLSIPYSGLLFKIDKVHLRMEAISLAPIRPNPSRALCCQNGLQSVFQLTGLFCRQRTQCISFMALSDTQ